MLGLRFGCGTDQVIYPPSPGLDGGVADSVATSFRYLIVPLHDTTQPISVEVGQEKQILIRVIDLDVDQPAVGFSVDTLLEQIIPPVEEGISGDASLTSLSAITDQDGLAILTFRAGEMPLILYDLTFSGLNAQPSTVQVAVSDVPTGTLRVSIQYEGPIPLKTVRVGVVKGTYGCSYFHPENPPTSDVTMKALLGTEAKASFEDLEAGTTYTVFAMATTDVPDEGEHLAAGGCLDGVYVQKELVNDVSLTLNVTTLKLAGTYRVEGVYDFTDVAVEFLNEQGLAGQILADVIIFFQEPGTIIVKYVEEAAKQFLPSLAVELVFDLIGDPIADALTDWLLDIPELQNFWIIGQDVTGVVSSMELVSLIQFSKVYSDYQLHGSEEFIGLTLTWKLGCDPEAPDYEECGKYTYTLEDFDDPDFPLDLASSQFTATILNWNQLQIDPHVLYVNYGKLIMFVINHVILPEIANGATSLSAAFQELLNCNNLSSPIPGIGDSAVQGACNFAVNLIGTYIESMISGLQWDSNLSLQGTCSLIDDDDNLVVDRLTNGVYSGSVIISGSNNASFEAVFEGEREIPGGAQ
jgi:hypothetical protein